VNLNSFRKGRGKFHRYLLWCRLRVYGTLKHYAKSLNPACCSTERKIRYPSPVQRQPQVCLGSTRHEAVSWRRVVSDRLANIEDKISVVVYSKLMKQGTKACSTGHVDRESHRRSLTTGAYIKFEKGLQE